MGRIRNSAKAIIIADGKILLTKNSDNEGLFYLLPGGGQEPFENLHDTLKRECLEKISVKIEIGNLLFIREYIGKNHEFAFCDSDVHQIEYIFECQLIERNEISMGSNPDSSQVGIEWIPLTDLKNIRIYPKILKNVITETGINKEKIYLGDIN